MVKCRVKDWTTEMTVGKVLYNTFINWCRETSIACLSKSVRSKSFLKKAYWLLLFFAGAYFTIDNLYRTVTTYLKYEVKTSNDLTFKTSILFPAVSICNQNRYVRMTYILAHFLTF